MERYLKKATGTTLTIFQTPQFGVTGRVVLVEDGLLILDQQGTTWAVAIPAITMVTTEVRRREIDVG